MLIALLKNHSGKGLLTLYVSYLALVATPARAAETVLAQLDPVVVTASRTERLQSEAPVRTEVITRTEIEQTHARSLKEALENVPGLQLREIHGKSGYEAMLQGMTSDQLLVLIDGMPMAASTGSSTDLSQLALIDVERIEVVKGAASAQFGSSAMGGVINVITRKADNTLRGSVTYDLGSYGSQNTSGKSSDVATNHINAALEGGRGAWSGRLSADVRDNKGFDADNDDWVRQGDDTNRRQAEAQLNWKASEKNYLTGSVQHFEEKDVQYMDPDDLDHLPNKFEDIDRDRFALESGWAFNNIQLTAKALDENYRSNSKKQYLGYSASYDNRDMKLDTQFYSLQLDIPASEQHNIQFGAEVRLEELTQFKDGVAEIGDDGHEDRQNYELFAQEDYFFSPAGELVLGLRVQDDSDFGFYASPKIALRYDLINNATFDAVVRTSVGTGYRVPNLKERYYTFDHSSLGYMVKGNEDLEPESSLSYQAGIQLNAVTDTRLDINVFYNDVDDLIQTDEDNFTTDKDGIAVYTYKNIDNALTYGIETAISQALFSSINITLAHTYTHAEDKDTGADLTRRPDHIARLGIDWQATSTLSLSTRLRYQSRELVSSEDNTWSPAWTTADLKMNYHVTLSTDVFAGIDNVTNRQRDFTTGTDFGPVAGRFIYLGATFNY